MLVDGKHLLTTFSENQITPIIDKDVDALIEYLTKSYAVDNSDNGGSSNLQAEEGDEAGDVRVGSKSDEESSSSPSNEEWSVFQKVSLQALSLCLDLFPNNGVLSDKQKKKIVFHGLLQLGSTPLTFQQLEPRGGHTNLQHHDKSANSTPSPTIIKLLKDALEIILSTALFSSSRNVCSNSNQNHQNSKNTTIGIEMLLTPYLSRLEQSNVSIQQYIIRICNNELNPMNAAALINSIIALLSSSLSIVSSSSSHKHKHKLISNEMMESFVSNLFLCLYNIAKSRDYDSIPPLIYQICQLIDNDLDHGTFILKSIISFLEYMLNCSTIIPNLDNTISSSENNNEDQDGTKSNKKNNNSYKKNQEIQWTIFTSLNHLGNVLRGNPLLPNVLLNILKSKGVKKKSSIEEVDRSSLSLPSSSSSSSEKMKVPPPFRYMKMTPILLAIGLTMATYIPRMRDLTLDTIRDLVYEESLIRIKRTKSDWFNACAAILLSSKDLKVSKEGQFKLLQSMSGDTSANAEAQRKWDGSLKKAIEEYRNHDNHVHDVKNSHMLTCLKSFLSMTGGSRDTTTTSSGQKSRQIRFQDAHTNSDLYPALVSLGFLLIDSVKKDTKIPFSNSAATCVHLVKELPSCSSAMNQNSNTSIQIDAQSATAEVGRELLKTMFLFVGMNPDDDDVIIGNSGYISHATLNPLCRSIVMTMFEKFCCMAPNAIEHSYLLREIAFARFEKDSNDLVFAQMMESVHFEEFVGASMLEESLLPNIIESLSNVPGGGMPPAVAMVSIIPTLRHIIRIAIKKERRNRRYCTQLDAHFDHCFLLAKKSLFCTDVERRKVAVQLLIMLVDLALERSKTNTAQIFGHSSSSVVDEGIGYIRRCLTQHQSDVRLEVYASLVALVPKFNESDSDESSSSPETSISVVSQILLNHLERYINVQEDKTIIQARRKRAIQLGTHLSQQPDETFDEPTLDLAPIRLQMCTRQPSRLAKHKSKLKFSQGVKRKKSRGNDDFIDDVSSCILEPISFLIASSIAVTREARKYSDTEEAPQALLHILHDLRGKVSASTLDQYLQSYDLDNQDSTEDAKIVSICILVGSIAESLMAIPSIDENQDLMDLDTIEKLFRLRSAAVIKASTILATHLSKPKSQKKKKTSDTKKEKSAEADDDQDNDDTNTTRRPEAKVKPQTLSKSQRMIENEISSLCPSNSQMMLSKCLRECGVLSVQNDSEDRSHLDQDDEEIEDQSVQMRLSASVTFRRFLLEKTESLLKGKCLVLRAGERFDCDQIIERNDCVGLNYIICSLQLGPICLAEFCSHVHHREFTSLTTQDDTPLAQVALQAFVYSIQRMTSFVRGHNMSRIQRLTTLLRSSIDTLCSQFPSMKTRIELIRQNQGAVCTAHMSEIEQNLTKMILPFIFPNKHKHPTVTCCGLLSELVENGLDGEAVLCSKMLVCIMVHLNVNLRQELGAIILKAFESCDVGSAKEGLFGLQHDCSLSSSAGCGKCAAQTVDAALYLSGQIDSLSELVAVNQNQRQNFGFSSSSKSLYEEIFDCKIVSEFNKGVNGIYGIPILLAMSFLEHSGQHHDCKEKALESLDKLSLRCTEIIATKAVVGNDSVSKDMVTTSQTISNMIDSALTDAEFVASKILPIASGISLTVARELLASRLLAVTMTIISYTPGSEFFDNQSSFTAFLLKCVKRVHITMSKLVSSHSTSSNHIVLAQSKALLQLWSGKLNKRTMSLLLVLQGINRTKDGKVVADSKIIAQGKIAGQVVFEKEKTDSIILNLSAKLKSKGINSDFLKEKIIVSTHRDFKIQVHELQAARERTDKTNRKGQKAAPKKKSKKKSKKNEDLQTNDAESNRDEEQSLEEKSIVEDQSVDAKGEDVQDDEDAQSESCDDDTEDESGEESESDD